MVIGSYRLYIVVITVATLVDIMALTPMNWLRFCLTTLDEYYQNNMYIHHMFLCMHVAGLHVVVLWVKILSSVATSVTDTNKFPS